MYRRVTMYVHDIVATVLVTAIIAGLIGMLFGSLLQRWLG
jgi:hypothetical protein